MPIEHIGVDAGPEGIRLVRVEAGFGTAEFRAYETRELGPIREPEPDEELEEESTEEPETSPETSEDAREDEESEEEDEDEELRGPAPWTPVEEAVQEALARLADEGVFETQFTAAAVETGRLTTRLLSFPFTNRKKLDLVLAPEFESLTPFEAEHFVFDHTTVGSAEGGALLQAYAIPQQALERFMTACENGHFDPRIVTTTGAALAALPLAVEASAGEAAGADAGDDEAPAEPPAGAEEAWSRHEQPVEGEDKEKKITGARTLLEANQCTGLLYLGEHETVLVVLCHGSPWLLHASSLTLAHLRADPRAADRLAGTLRRQLMGFEANHGLRPDQLWVLGAGATESTLCGTIASATGLACEPARLDEEAAGEEAARTLEEHPESALAMALAYLSARARQIPAPNFRRGPYAFRSRWRELAEPLSVPAALAVVAMVLFLINSLVEFRNYRDQVGIARAQLKQLYTEARGKAPPESADPVQLLASEVEEKRARLEIFRKISGISVLNILAELSRSIEDDTPVDFENFRIDNDRVSINGKLDDYAAVDEVKNYLSDSRLFSQVHFRDAVPGTDDKIKFRLSLTLATADADEEEFLDEEPEEPDASMEAPVEDEPAAPAAEAEPDTATLQLPLGAESAPEPQAPPAPAPEQAPAAPEPAEAEKKAAERDPDSIPDEMLTPAQRRMREQLKLRTERDARDAERRRKRMEEAAKQPSEGTGDAEQARDKRIREQRERVRERIEELRKKRAQERGITPESGADETTDQEAQQ